ncbi:hypothetical protein M9458_034768, partial [Cirrhinus mrigala]
EPIPETATYGALRPYRESPLLARARRTESFHSYRDFHSLNLTKALLENHGQCGSTEDEMRQSTGENNGEDPDKRNSTMDLWASRSSETQSGAVRKPPDSPGDQRRRAHLMEEGAADSRPDGGRRRGAFEANFLSRKKAPPVPQLSPPPAGADGGSSDSSSTASPSPTKVSTSPRHRKAPDTACE